MIKLVPFALVIVVVFSGAVQAQEATSAISVYSQYTSIGVGSTPPDHIELDLTISNAATEAAVVQIRVLSGPEGWDAGVYSKFKKVDIHRVELRPDDETKDLAFRFLVPEGVEDGDYKFVVGFFEGDDRALEELEYHIKVGESRAEEDRVGQGPIVELEPRYTGLTGSKDSSFKFRVDLKNKGVQDEQFDLEGDGPVGWEVSFTPAFQDTLIASLGLRADTDQALEVTVKPPGNAEPGRYTILLRATAEGLVPAEVPIQVQLTGTPVLSVGTLTGRLNANATAGEGSEIKLVVANAGSVGVDSIRLVSNAPEGWRLNFEPQVIPRLEPSALAEITATVTPPAKSLPGDYRITVIATSVESQADASLRITVGRSTAIGWVGILIVVLVVAALGGLFVKLGRR